MLVLSALQNSGPRKVITNIGISFASIVVSVAVIAFSLVGGTAYAAPLQYNWGLWQNSNNLQYSLGSKFPTLAIQYYAWNENPQTADMNAAWSNGIEPFLEMQSCTTTKTNCDTEVPPTNITSGQDDPYLTTFANALASFNHPVLLTFDHEMNGSWYPWGDGGSGGVTPTQWINMWHHVTSLIHGIAPNVSFIWAPNIENGIAGFDQYWPGLDFSTTHVNLVGLDGYYRDSTATWSNTFAPSVSDIKRVSGNKPFVVAETGVNNADTNYLSQIDNLMNNAYQSAGAVEVFYFDQSGTEWGFTTAGQTRFCSDLNLSC